MLVLCVCVFVCRRGAYVLLEWTEKGVEWSEAAQLGQPGDVWWPGDCPLTAIRLGAEKTPWAMV